MSGVADPPADPAKGAALEQGDGVGNCVNPARKGIATRPEIEASGVYYCEIGYDQEYPSTWTFEAVS